MTLCCVPSAIGGCSGAAAASGGGATSDGGTGSGSASAIGGIDTRAAPSMAAAIASRHPSRRAHDSRPYRLLARQSHFATPRTPAAVVAITRKSTVSALLLPRPTPGERHPSGRPASGSGRISCRDSPSVAETAVWTASSASLRRQQTVPDGGQQLVDVGQFDADAGPDDQVEVVVLGVPGIGSRRDTGRRRGSSPGRARGRG